MDEGRREQILDGLEDVFLRDGFRRVTVGQLASRLRCSRRALYELAASKEELFVLVLERLLRGIRGRGEEGVRGAATLPEKIEAYLAPGIAGVRRATHFFTADLATFPEAKQRFDDHQRERLAGLRDIITEALRRGVARGFDPHLVAEILSIAYRRASDPDFLAETNLSMTEAYREIGQLLCHGLLHPVPGAPGPRVRGRRRVLPKRPRRRVRSQTP